MIYGQKAPGRRTQILFDLALLAWVAAWIVLGIFVGREVQGLETLADTTVRAGQALDTAGQALGGVAEIPLVGENVRELADQTRSAGQSAVESGRASRDSISNLSVLLAVVIAIVPSLPYVLLYVPVRLAWRRQTAELGG